ncbi:unnamed protein product, partial [marine sediment metagenome]
MPKAGLYAAEVTTNAPADGAATLKQKGYIWMEWGVPPVIPGNCNEIWDVGTLIPDLHVAGVGLYDPQMMTFPGDASYTDTNTSTSGNKFTVVM